MSDAVGIDIGTHALKVVQVARGGSAPELKAIGSVPNPTGQFLPNEPARFRNLAESISQALQSVAIKTNECYASIPESLASTTVISLPYLTDAELASSIHWEAEQYIPGDLKDYNLEYDILYRPQKGSVGEKMKVLLVAAKKADVEQMVALYNLAGLDVLGVETGMLAAYRCLSTRLGASDGAVIVCNLGHSSTELLIVEQGVVVLSYAVPTGGAALSRSIEKGLGLSLTQAEEYKRAHGLDPAQFEGKIAQVLTPVVEIIINEIKKAIHYYSTSAQRSSVRSIVMTGGSAYLPGLQALLSERFGYEVSLAQPLEGWNVGRNLQLPQDIAVYTIPLGLVLRDEE